MECRTIFIEEVPRDLRRYYADEYYQIPTLDKLRKVARAEHYKIDMVKTVAESGSLLEVGPAFGVFAYQAKEAGFTVDTIEMDGRCCDFLRDVVGVHAVQSDRPHEAVACLRQHDVIALWHVLEHLAEPWECLKALVGNLTPGGVLLIAMPNPEAFQFKVMGADWPHVDAPRHVQLIPKATLTEYVKRLGLDLVMMTTDDPGGRGWNRFGWQRYLMNRVRGRWAQRACFVAGYVLSAVMSGRDRQGLEGSAYTAIFRNKAAS